MDIKRFRPISGRLTEIWYEDKSYLAFVPKPLPPTAPLNSSELMLALSEADRALGELAGLGRTMPNPQLLINPFIRREAVASSRIEGTQTGIEELYAYEAGQLPLPGMESSTLDSDAQEVRNYVQSLEYGIAKQKSAPVDLELIRDMHRLLMKGVRGEYSRPGEFRAIQNWIGGGRIRNAQYVPPPISELPELLNSFEEYITSSHDLPPLLRLALIHYHFEAIHPFGDGNGRTGRLLISLLLIHWGLLPLPLLYLSAYFEKRRSEYFDLLLAVSEQGKWNDWLIFFLHGVAEQAKDAIERAKKLQDLQIDWYKRLTQIRASVLTLSLADKLFEAPITTISDAQRRLGLTNYKTAQRYTQKLVDTKILHLVNENAYGKVYIANEILNILLE